METPWYANAVIYSLDVREFQDSDGDGVGDFDGLSSRLDYLSTLGVTALWLLPFFPGPYRDAGYDVTDYFGVDDRVGGMSAYVRFAKRAQEAGIRLIVDLPLNHTSVEHPWFQAARSDRSSPYRDFYIWADEPPPSSEGQIVFSGEPNPWTYDEQAGQHYLHRFYAHEPDLNHGNPAVRGEVLRIIEFWLNMGASGVRVDAAPYIAKKSSADPTAPGPHPFLREMHHQAITVRPDAMLMAEADVRPAELRSYFGEGDEMQMLFAFLLNAYFFLALARQEAEPIVKVLGILPHRPPGGQWASWVRNHDELDLERLSSREREDVMRAFAPEEDMQIYGRGIRRRFPPMVDGDQRRVELAYNLLFSLPGSPIIRYGEEIGMGDDLSLPERNAVRTTMQWSSERNGGFSTCDPDDLLVPTIAEGPFGYREVSVAEQQLDRDSLLARMKLFVSVRRQHPEIGSDLPEIVDSGDPAVLALRYGDGDATVTVQNLAGSARSVHLEQLREHRYRYDLLADHRYEPLDAASAKMELAPYGYRWFVARSASPEQAPPTEAATGALSDQPK